MRKALRVLFYMPVSYYNLKDRGEDVRKHKIRGELMYNIIDTEKYGCEVVFPQTKLFPLDSKKLYLYYTFHLISIIGSYDIIYSPYYQGIEWLIYLKALGLFRKKVVVWHHNPIEKPKGLLSKIRQSLFLRGCDSLLFFSKAILDSSEYNQKLQKKMKVVNWGPDMSFFDLKRVDYSQCEGNYLMSGCDSRDFETAMSAFVSLPQIEFDFFPPSELLFEKFRGMASNTHVRYFKKINENYEKLAEITANCKAVIIITKPVPGRKLPSGLTSICEAVALGKPCIITDNPYFSDEMRHAGFSKFVKVGDVEGIRKAIVELEENPQLRLRMSEAALAYARKYSSENTAKQLVEIFKNVLKK